MRIYFRKELYNFSLKPFYWLNRWTFDSSVGISPVSQFNCSRSTAFSKAGNLSKDGLKTIWITHRKGLRLGAWEKCIGCGLTWGFRHKQPSLLKSGRRWWRGSVFLGIQPFLLLLKCLAHRPFHLLLSVRFSLFFFVYLFMSSLAYVFVYKYIYIYIYKSVSLPALRVRVFCVNISACDILFILLFRMLHSRESTVFISLYFSFFTF